MSGPGPLGSTVGLTEEQLEIYRRGWAAGRDTLHGARVYVAIVKIDVLPIGVFTEVGLACDAILRHPEYRPGQAFIAFHRINEGPEIESL